MKQNKSYQCRLYLNIAIVAHFIYVLIFLIQKFQNAFIGFPKTGMKRDYTCDLAEGLEFSDVLLVCHARLGEKSYFYSFNKTFNENNSILSVFWSGK